MLSGCNSIKEAAGNMMLGENLVQAAENIDHCDMSGLNTLEHIAKTNHDIRGSAALIALGANYAAAGNTAKINTIAKQLHTQTPNKTLEYVKQEIINSGKTQQQNCINNGLSGNCQ